ncbi:type II secretion system F family protein [Nakamurella multipartita]|uniref:Type II secretion system protein n=1 Tax=Nakamurella multipartita (strain ATCC 700099 / DSM 44233 / CIP 104796 / JCM 9543 / NBRC 105858 / Y-104) TaxID=479431 RepID=C8X8Q2_NAKMY|nr:type II secretion system F family protein [Nakamurella multipartita]ACV79107.1 type II secretion system protein [Nakamurella multipartita DSM 44233]
MIGQAWLPVLLGAGIGAGILLMVAGSMRRPVRSSDPTSWSRLFAAIRSPSMSIRVVGGALAAIGVLALTGWPVAAAAAGGLIWAWPRLVGGVQAEQRQIARLDALVAWTESLRDTIAGHHSLENALPSSAVHASPLIRPALLRLVGQIRARVPVDRALVMLADELNDPSADLVIAELVLSAKRRGDGLQQRLSSLATTAREELEMRRRIFADRAEIRRGTQIIVVVTVVFAGLLVVFGGDYVRPYSTLSGQVVLAIVVGIFAAAFAWLRRLADQRPVARFLQRPSGPAHTSESDRSTAAVVR